MSSYVCTLVLDARPTDTALDVFVEYTVDDTAIGTWRWQTGRVLHFEKFDVVTA